MITASPSLIMVPGGYKKNNRKRRGGEERPPTSREFLSCLKLDINPYSLSLSSLTDAECKYYSSKVSKDPLNVTRMFAVPDIPR